MFVLKILFYFMLMQVHDKLQNQMTVTSRIFSNTRQAALTTAARSQIRKTQFFIVFGPYTQHPSIK